MVEDATVGQRLLNGGKVAACGMVLAPTAPRCHLGMSDLHNALAAALRAMSHTRSGKQFLSVRRLGRIADHDERRPVFGVGPFRVLRVFNHR